MIDPDFDPLEDLQQLMFAVSAQHHQIANLLELIHQQNHAIKNINCALRVARHQLSLMENRINEIDTRTAGRSPRP